MNYTKYSFFLLTFLCGYHSSRSQNVLAQENFELDGIKEVRVNGSFCDVTIDGYNGQSLTFDGVITGRSGKSYSIEYDRSGSYLKIWIETPISSWGSVNCDLKLKVPKDIDVTVDNSSGDVFISNLSGRSLEFEVSSGDLEVEDVNSDLSLRSSSGDIDLRGLIGDLEIRSSSGSIRADRVEGNIEGRSSSGRINLNDIEGDIVAETTSGGISLDGVKGGLELESTSGSLEGEEIEITANSYFESSSGSIDMELTNDLETLSFDLKASSGSLRVGSKRAEDRYIDKRSGGLLIRGVSSSGSQRYDN